MTKGLIIIASLAILFMVFSQVLLSIHPDGKEFSESFVSSNEYLQALPKYRDHPLTEFRQFWVANYKLLRVIFLGAILVLVVSTANCVLLRKRSNA